MEKYPEAFVPTLDRRPRGVLQRLQAGSKSTTLFQVWKYILYFHGQKSVTLRSMSPRRLLMLYWVLFGCFLALYLQHQITETVFTLGSLASVLAILGIFVWLALHPLLLMGRGKLQEAKLYYEKVLKWTPPRRKKTVDLLQYHIANLMMTMGEFSEAEKVLHSVDPNLLHPWVKFNFYFLNLLVGFFLKNSVSSESVNALIEAANHVNARNANVSLYISFAYDLIDEPLKANQKMKEHNDNRPQMKEPKFKINRIVSSLSDDFFQAVYFSRRGETIRAQEHFQKVVQSAPFAVCYSEYAKKQIIGTLGKRK